MIKLYSRISYHLPVTATNIYLVLDGLTSTLRCGNDYVNGLFNVYEFHNHRHHAILKGIKGRVCLFQSAQIEVVVAGLKALIAACLVEIMDMVIQDIDEAFTFSSKRAHI
ncbi:hypothetical protein Tco_0795779 [Tanacetum coccineum]